MRFISREGCTARVLGAGDILFMYIYYVCVRASVMSLKMKKYSFLVLVV